MEIFHRFSWHIRDLKGVKKPRKPKKHFVLKGCGSRLSKFRKRQHIFEGNTDFLQEQRQRKKRLRQIATYLFGDYTQFNRSSIIVQEHLEGKLTLHEYFDAVVNENTKKGGQLDL